MSVIILVLPIDDVKVLRFKQTNEQLSAGRTQYVFINNIQTKMKKKYDLAPLSAAHALTVSTLKKADRAFYRQRRTMEDSYGMPHGTFSGV